VGWLSREAWLVPYRLITKQQIKLVDAQESLNCPLIDYVLPAQEVIVPPVAHILHTRNLMNVDPPLAQELHDNDSSV